MSKVTTVGQTLEIYLKTSLGKNKNDAIFALLTPIGGIFTNIGVPFFAGKTLADIAAKNGQFDNHIKELLVCAVIGIIFNRLGFTRLMRLQANVMSNLNEMVLKKILQRGLRFHINQISGKLVSDALDFITSYSTLLISVYMSALSLSLILLSGVVVVTIQSWKLGAFLFLIVLIILIWAYYDSKTRSKVRSIRLEASKKLIGHLSDTIVNAQTVKTFAAEKKELNTSKSLNKTLLKLRVEDWQRAGISGNNRWSFLLAMIFLLLIYINYLAKTDPMVLGIGVFSFTFTFTIMLRLFDINTLTRQVEEAFLQASPMTKILLEVDEVVDSINASELVIKDTTIEFNDVSFDYNEGKNNSPVFKNLNLHIKSGEKVGLVGPSGGGKSTLTRLILRFEDIQSGSIRIDNQNITLVTQKSLRESVAYVPQEPLLFHRSISENIGYGANCDLEEIVAAARLAYADEFIANLPNGYDTIVGERGVKLSGGQRQRVAIARAILRNSPILILDEATSALDSESEVYIQKALQELMKQKTTIVIAHRLSTIQKMDRIIVMDDGKIIEQGTHAALLSKDGMYARLWNHQSGGFLQEDPED